MDDVGAFFGIALGVLIAVIFPVLKGYVLGQFGPTAAPGLPPWVKKYGALFLFSLVTALIVLAVFRNVKPDTEISFWFALLLGFGYEASIEKAVQKPLTA
jgi:predicted lysophospholipase L1 biosynthesis ABC-type transport system permease subunit